MRVFQNILQVETFILNPRITKTMCQEYGEGTKEGFRAITSITDAPIDGVYWINFRESEGRLYADLQCDARTAIGRMIINLIQDGVNFIGRMNFDSKSSLPVIHNIRLEVSPLVKTKVSVLDRVRPGDFIHHDVLKTLTTNDLFHFLVHHGMTTTQCNSLCNAITELDTHLYVGGDGQFYKTSIDPSSHRFFAKPIKQEDVLRVLYPNGVPPISVSQAQVDEQPETTVKDPIRDMTIEELGKHIAKLRDEYSFTKRRAEDLKVEINSMYDRITKVIGAHVNKIAR